MLNFYYKQTIKNFLDSSIEQVIGSITLSNQFDAAATQNKSWEQQTIILKTALQGYEEGTIFFEFSIPRMGKRVDCLVLLRNIVFVIEFKVGEEKFLSHHYDQVWDYALDLKNFHKPSNDSLLVPILVATEAKFSYVEVALTPHNDNLAFPLRVNKKGLQQAIKNALGFSSIKKPVDAEEFCNGSYSPTPTIIEAAVQLYNSHSVHEITRSEAEATNLTKTSTAISAVIDYARIDKRKIICFVTGVPGAGKTLVGLNVATTNLGNHDGATSIYLSGNAPLVAILQEALARDTVRREKLLNRRITKSTAKEGVKAFIQIIHHYRDEYLRDPKAPFDHVAIFDEAQRVWNKEQTVKFMAQKKGNPDFDQSEPEYLISCLDRHEDWAVIVCLVGGGQEINTGEAGISEWLTAVQKFPNWEVAISPNLIDSEYAAVNAIDQLKTKQVVNFSEDLHLSVSMRSFRAEKVSYFVKSLLDLEDDEASRTLTSISSSYPIRLTRDLGKAKSWLKKMARGSERYGIVVSSQAQRLKPLAIDVKSPINPVNWFLEGKDDIRSSYYLEDVATEFHVQGLELDWVCVTWDGDLRHNGSHWNSYSFVGTKWQNIHKSERKKYLINAYRVLLTRARQGMVIVVPEGDIGDPTRLPTFYQETYDYLESLGIELL
jgi:hypothetical protein